MKTFNVSIFVIAIFLCTLFFSDAAFAQGAGIQATIDNCKNYEKDNRILGPVVQCITDVMNAVTQQYINNIVNLIKDAVVTVMTIAIIFLGARVALGSSRKPYSEVSILMIKLTLVSYFVLASGVNEYLTLLTDFTAGLSDLLISVLRIDKAYTVQKDVVDLTTSTTSVVATVQPPGGKELWFQIDFMLQRLLGLGGSDTKLLNAMIGIALIMVGLFSMGPVGGWIGVITMFTLATVFGAFVMAIFTYIASMVAIMVLGAISPLIIPMILFQQTKPLFDKWVSQLLSYALQPVILTSFLIFMVAAMDNAVVDMIRIHQDAYGTATGADGHNSAPLVAGQDTQKKISLGGMTDEESHSFFLNKVVAGLGIVPVTNPSAMKGFGGNDMMLVPVLSKDHRFVQELSLNLLLSLFLGYVLLIFIYELPKLVTDLIGDRTVPDLVSRFGKPAFSAIMKTEGAAVSHMSKLSR